MAEKNARKILERLERENWKIRFGKKGWPSESARAVLNELVRVLLEDASSGTHPKPPPISTLALTTEVKELITDMESEISGAFARAENEQAPT